MVHQHKMKENPRKRVSILFMDIEGYTAMMHRDEERAIEVIQKFNRIVKSETQKAGGSIIQYYGDACLITFDNARAAVECACAMQLGFGEGIKIPVRMGIHSGDVWYKDENIYGDAVNIASRIETMGVPGAVLISSDLQGQLDVEAFPSASLGKFHFKNVPKPMEIHALVSPSLRIPKRQDLRERIQSKQGYARRNQMILGLSLMAVLLLIFIITFRYWNSADSGSDPVLAIYPFGEEGGLPAPDGQLFAVSIAEMFAKTPGLTTISPDDLNKARKVMHQANIIPLNSEQSFLDTLRATHYLKGKIGKKISLQLFHASDTSRLWEMAFDITDPDEIQKEIYLEILGQLGLAPAIGVVAQFDEKRDARVLELFKKALQNWNDRGEKDSYARVIDLLSTAHSLDSTDHQVNGLLALAYQTGIEREYYAEIETPEIERRVLRFANLALAFNPRQPYALIAKGSYDFYHGDYQSAKVSLEKAHAIAPEMGMTTQALADFSLYTGDYANALQYIKQANAATPGDKTILRYLSWCLMSNGLVEASRENTERRLMFYPDSKPGNYYLWAYSLILKDYDSALENIPRSVSPAFRNLMEGIIYLDSGREEGFDRVLNRLRQLIRAQCDTLNNLLPRERIPEDHPLFQTLKSPFMENPEAFNTEIDKMLSEIEQFWPAGEYHQLIINACKRLEGYESALNSLVLLGYLHKGGETEKATARRYYAQYMAEGNRLPIQWLVQTYPFECFNSLRTDPAIQETAASYGIHFGPHPWFDMVQ